PPFVRVERALQLGLTWSVTTRVERLTPPGSAVVLEVPLLPGESVTTQEIRVSGGKALLNMGPNAVHAQWSSVLSPRPALALRAPPGVAWTEVWTLDASSLWHVEARGIPAVAQWDGDGPRTPQWRPWPGEEVTLSVVRPTAAQGQTLTVDGSRLLVVPGFRASEVTLTANLRSSRGGRHPVVLPEGALLQSARVNGTQQPIRQEGRGVSVALAPGSTSLELVFRLPQGLAALYRTPQVDLGVPSVNAAVEIQTAGRWVLAVGGPGTGPAVLFWSFLLVLMVVALALGRVRWTPLRAHDWALLAVGLSQVPVIAAAWVAVWLLALGYRAERGGAVEVRWRFNLVQLTLLGLTLVALGILMGSIYGGLLGEPEMQVQGNGSTASHLRWYQDRVGAELPRAWVASVSMWVYRGVMLLWALWLAFALLRWLRWGWAAFSTGGLWRQRPLRARVVPPAAPPAVPPA
ncbi:MAG TPA: hypothetical protein VEY30_05030, partial [Myxococcaceae bacterium]|nr:hypothetical protein [Myxococcaceae bacterium]